MLDKIVQDYTPRLRAYIRTQVANSDDAEDILQEVFYQLAKTTAGNAGAIEKVSAWLYRVARNAILNFWRKRRESPLLISEPSDDEAACGNLSDILFCPANSEPDNVYLRKLVWRELSGPGRTAAPAKRGVLPLGVRGHAGQGYRGRHGRAGVDRALAQALRRHPPPRPPHGTLHRITQLLNQHSPTL